MSEIYIGTPKLSKLYAGVPKASKIYIGTGTIWQGTIPIERPTSAQLNPSGTYSGSSISNGFSMTGVEYVRGDVSGTNVGVYTAYYRPDAEHVWADTGDREEVACTLTINFKYLTIPSLSNTTQNYSGGSKAPTVNNYDSTWETQDGTTAAVNGGNYSVTWNLRDTSNTRWSDGTNSQKSGSWLIQYVWQKWNSSLYYTQTSRYETVEYLGEDILLPSGSYVIKGGSPSFNTSNGLYSFSCSYCTSSGLHIDNGSTACVSNQSYSVGQTVYTSQCITNYSGGDILVYLSGRVSSGDYYDKQVIVRGSTSSYVKGGTYYGNVSNTSNVYPSNGRHSDGYWYVKTW